MKNIRWLSTAWVAVTLGALAAWAGEGGPVTRRGTSVLHYMSRNSLQSTDPGSNVVGQLRLQFNEQGHSQKQSLRLVAGGLDAATAYSLIAVLGEDTNAVLVSNVESDAAGRLRLNYLTKAQGHGGRNPLPVLLDPLTNVRSIGLENASTQTVAYAWIADAEQFQYIVKRNLTADDTNGTAAGSISLIANQRHVNFRLLAGGLGPTNDYHLALNSNIVSNVEADENGRLQIKEWPAAAPAVLELRSLSLLDGSNNVVLHTPLPK